MMVIMALATTLATTPLLTLLEGKLAASTSILKKYGLELEKH
jgi:hypothetical protein